MICVIVRADHGVEFDITETVILEELPINEIGGILSTVLIHPWPAAINDDVLEVRSLDQYSIPLANIDEIELREGLAAETSVVERAPIDGLKPIANVYNSEAIPDREGPCDCSKCFLAFGRSPCHQSQTVRPVRTTGNSGLLGIPGSVSRSPTEI